MRFDHRLTIAAALLALCSCSAIADESAKPTSQPKPIQTSAWVGTNYTPAYCGNAVQMWHDFKPDVIEKELAAAKEYFGINTLRVYLHNIVFDNEKDLFLKRIDQFIRICAKYEIKPGFVFFDDCWNHSGITFGPQEPPVDGRHNGRWAACPQDNERKDENLPKFKAYVQEVIKAHKDDNRVLWWEVFNEPNSSPFSAKLRVQGYAWAKEVKPSQPILCCWDNSPETDIVDAHNYTADFASWDRQADMDPAKGTVFTEAGARWFAPRTSSGSPTEVIHWLKDRKASGKYVPGVYLCWELMAGNSNCRWYWGTPDGASEPTVPWCGLLFPDGTPVSYAEAEAIHSYTTGISKAMFFDDFEGSTSIKTERMGWKYYGADQSKVSYMSLPANTKMITGDPNWTNYMAEAAVMLKSAEGNAGIIIRANNPGPGPDDLKGYYIGFNTQTLYLGKFDQGWKELASYDLRKLPCKVEPGVWNRVRASVEGNHIKVWFNPLHDDPGLRIDFTDTNSPITKGNFGLRTFNTEAWFDDVVVLPVK